MGGDNPVTCSCGGCIWSRGIEEELWFGRRPEPYWNWSGDGDLNYCPACADRLNADGTVTPRHEWIAEELDARAGVCCERSVGKPHGNNDETAGRAYLMASSALRMNLGAPDPADEKLEVASDALG